LNFKTRFPPLEPTTGFVLGERDGKGITQVLDARMKVKGNNQTTRRFGNENCFSAFYLPFSSCEGKNTTKQASAQNEVYKTKETASGVSRKTIVKERKRGRLKSLSALSLVTNGIVFFFTGTFESVEQIRRRKW
jgi:hypothetical protein